MEIVSFAAADVPAELRRQAVALRQEAWPRADGSGSDAGHDPALRPVSMLAIVDGRVVATLDILSKEITHSGQRFAASGLSSVVTAVTERRRGYGRLLVVAARDWIETSGVDLALFTCDRPLQPFYEQAGWRLLPATVLVGGTPAAPFPSDQFDKVTLGCFFTAKAQRFAASFIGSRIELHSGEIDRLW